MVRGFSSAGRAPALQAGGQRFEPAKLHHIFPPCMQGWKQQIFPEMKTAVSVAQATDLADLPPFFDIVNGFFNRCRGGILDACVLYAVTNQNDYLAEIILSTKLTLC
jgi:hypothetical protein